MVTGKLVVTVACTDAEQARKIGRALVESGLAACAQIVPSIESIYPWEGQIEQATEALLILKTNISAWNEGDLEGAIRKLHSYQVPEILAVPVVLGSEKYLAWMDEHLRRQA